MAANVVERVNRAVSISSDDETFSADVYQEVIAWFLDPLDTSRINPAIPEKHLQVALKSRAICEIPCGKGLRYLCFTRHITSSVLRAMAAELGSSSTRVPSRAKISGSNPGL